MPSDNLSPIKLSPIAQELGKRNPFELLEEEVFVGLLRTSDMMTAGFNRLFEEQGFSEKLYNTLRIIAEKVRLTNGESLLVSLNSVWFADNRTLLDLSIVWSISVLPNEIRAPKTHERVLCE